MVKNINKDILDIHKKTDSLYEFDKLISENKTFKDKLYDKVTYELYAFFHNYQVKLRNISFYINCQHNSDINLSLEDENLNNCEIIFTPNDFKFNINENQYHITIELSSINGECYKNCTGFIINKANLINNLPNAYKACQDLLIHSYDKIILNFEKELSAFLDNYKNNIDKINNDLDKKINLYMPIINDTKEYIGTLDGLTTLQNINKNIDIDEDIER